MVLLQVRRPAHAVLPAQQVQPVARARRGPAPRPMLQVLAPEVHPAAQVPPVRQAARRAHNGSGTGAGSLADYVVLQHVTTHKSLHGAGHGGLWLRSTDGSEPRLLKEGDVISRADFDRVYWADDGNAGGEFQFVASNAQGEPVAHATPHVVPISGHESPAAPEYATSPVVHMQHDAVAALEASLFTGTNASLKPAAVRIEKIQATNADGSVSENGTPALLLDPDGDGPEKGTRVTEGQRISADDFGKLRWDANGSEGGRLTFRPVDADGFDYGTSQQVTIHEHQQAPLYMGGDGPQRVGHGGSVTLPETLFSGLNDSQKPAFVRITAIDAKPAGTDSAGVMSTTVNGEKLPVKVGDLIPADQFDAIAWNASGNAGGTFTFEALDASKFPIAGVSAQAVEVQGSPAAPVYDTEYVRLAHDHVTPLDRTLFAGTDSTREPAFIQITVLANNPNDGTSTGGLMFDADGDGPEAPEAVYATQVIAREDFGKLSWDTTGNKGGVFVVAPMEGNDLNHALPILGADGLPVSQGITVHESRPVPDYTADNGITDMNVRFNNEDPIPFTFFTGDNEDTIPPAVRIDSVKPTNPDDPDAPALLLLDPDGDGPEAARAVKEGDTIQQADYEHLRWNSTHNEGGTVTFTALDVDGEPIIGAEPQTLHVHEQPLPPVYEQEADPVAAPFQQLVALGENHLAKIIGSEENRAPAAIRIVETQAPHLLDGASTPLYMKGEDGTLTPMNADESNNIISAADFAKLVWDASKSDGGSITFEPLDARGEAFLGDDGNNITHRIDINEDAVAGYSKDGGKTVPNVITDSITWLTPNAYGPAPETLRFFKMGGISAWENGGYTRIVMDKSISQDGNDRAYEIILHGGLTREQAEAEAAERGATLLTIDSQQELKWLQDMVKNGKFGIHGDASKGTDDTDLSGYLYTSKLGAAAGTVVEPGSGTKGFIVEYSDYRSPLRLYSESGTDDFRYVHEGDVLTNRELQRLAWDSTKNNGGKFWMAELEPKADDASQPSDTVKNGWPTWGFQERSRNDTTGTWEEWHEKVGLRSPSTTSGKSLGTQHIQDAPDTQDASATPDTLALHDLSNAAGAQANTSTNAQASTGTPVHADAHTAGTSPLSVWQGISPLVDDPLHPSVALI